MGFIKKSINWFYTHDKTIQVSISGDSDMLTLLMMNLEI